MNKLKALLGFTPKMFMVVFSLLLVNIFPLPLMWRVLRALPRVVSRA